MVTAMLSLVVKLVIRVTNWFLSSLLFPLSKPPKEIAPRLILLLIFLMEKLLILLLILLLIIIKILLLILLLILL